MATSQVSERTIEILEQNYLNPHQESKNPAILAAIKRYRESKQAYMAVYEPYSKMLYTPPQEPSYTKLATDFLSTAASYFGGVKQTQQLDFAVQAN